MDRQIELWDPLGIWPGVRRWLWGALALLTVINIAPGFIDNLRPGPMEGVDFFQEWASAKNWREGLPIYTDIETTARRYLGYVVQPGERILIRWNAHPPSSVLLALPFAALGYQDAMLAWNLVSLAALLLTLGLVSRALNLKPPLWVVMPAVTLALLCNPLRQQVNQGQLNLLLLLLFILIWVAARSGRFGWAGAFLGMATAMKLFPGFFFLYFLLRRQWRVVASGIGALAAVTALTIVILGVDTYRSYATEVVPQVSAYRNWWPNVSLAGFWTKWLDTGAVSPVVEPDLPGYLPPVSRKPLVARGGLLLTALAIAAFWARAVWRSRTPRETDWAFGLTFTAMLLLSPIAWDHYLLFLLLPITQLWIALSDARGARVVLLVLAMCIWASPFDIWITFIPPPGAEGSPIRSLLVVSYQFFALLGLFILGIMFARRSDDKARSVVPVGSS